MSRIERTNEKYSRAGEDKPAIEPADRAGLDIARILSPLTPDQRVHALFVAGRSFCEHCGYPAPPTGYCQCTNDE